MLDSGNVSVLMHLVREEGDRGEGDRGEEGGQAG